ncbi:hypothetical protein PR048_017473 [Dryococelus australis]|uniref:Uncharacterized protein n=1 Tax=Dryococelus australis TaxID=614101 RepID=A0ABQ9H9Q2_9NEOP|nr:hypothetical protein PR048_017473 [Dryococelus australis]
MLASHKSEPGLIPGRVAPGFSHAGSVPSGFFEDLPFPPPFRSDAAPYSPQSPSSALKISMLRAAQITSLALHPSSFLHLASKSAHFTVKGKKARLGKNATRSEAGCPSHVTRISTGVCVCVCAGGHDDSVPTQTRRPDSRRARAFVCKHDERSPSVCPARASEVRNLRRRMPDGPGRIFVMPAYGAVRVPPSRVHTDTDSSSAGGNEVVSLSSGHSFHALSTFTKLSWTEAKGYMMYEDFYRSVTVRKMAVQETKLSLESWNNFNYKEPKIIEKDGENTSQLAKSDKPLKSRRGRSEERVEQRRNARTGETGNPRGNPPVQRHRPTRYPHAEIWGRTPPEIEPDSPCWEASSLTSSPPRPRQNRACASFCTPGWPCRGVIARRRSGVSTFGGLLPRNRCRCRHMINTPDLHHDDYRSVSGGFLLGSSSVGNVADVAISQWVSSRC